MTVDIKGNEIEWVVPEGYTEQVANHSQMKEIKRKIKNTAAKAMPAMTMAPERIDSVSANVEEKPVKKGFLRRLFN